jgi:RNA polymerase sigma factor (sigma-70 family)
MLIMNAEVLESIVATHLPAASNGDQQAYGRIVEGCQTTVTSIALAIVRDVPASEDIAQEAFISAWQQLKKLNNPSSFMPWLRQITRNLSLDYLRSQKYRANPAGDIEAMMLAVADPTPGPSEFLAEQEDAKIAAAVIDALPEESREVLLLYYREGQSTQQVAALLGMQNAAVRKRLSRARQSIREELLQRVGEFAKSTSPSMAFTAMVTTSPAIMDSSNIAAAAGVLATAATGTSMVSKGLFTAGILSALTGAVLGVMGGIAGVWAGIAHLVLKPFDAKEKRDLLIYGTVNSLAMVIFTLGLFLVPKLSVWATLLACIAIMLCLMFSAIIWLPNILKRRAEFDHHNAATDSDQAPTTGFFKQFSTLYSKQTPRYQLRNTLTGNMHFWINGVPGEFLAPFDAQEKKELNRFVLVTNGLYITLIGGIALTLGMKSWLQLSSAQSLSLLAIVCVSFISAIATCLYIWLPRILSRRVAFERARDPIAFETTHNKQRAYGFVGLLVGLLLGITGLIVGLLSSGRL